MNSNAKLWIEKLRSGEFAQTRGRLRKDNSYCCLGVACELYRLEHPDTQWRSPYGYDDPLYEQFILEGLTYDAALPTVVKDWLGLRSEIGVFITNRIGPHPPGLDERKDSLAQMNDCGYLFTDIADVIESEPEGLFQ